MKSDRPTAPPDPIEAAELAAFEAECERDPEIARLERAVAAAYGIPLEVLRGRGVPHPGRR